MKIFNFFNYLKENVRYIFSSKEFILEKVDYNKEWKNKKSRLNNARFLEISKLIHTKSSVLDLGCGNCDLLFFLKKKNQINIGLGIDNSFEGINKCLEKKINAKNLNIMKIDFSNFKKFDYIIFSEVIEHISDCENLLVSLNRSFGKGLIITIPNMGYIWYRMRFLLGRFPIDEGRPFNIHLRFWTQKDFLIWARQLGFRTKAVKGCAGFPILWKYFPSLFSRNNLYFLIKDSNFNRKQ